MISYVILYLLSNLSFPPLNNVKVIAKQGCFFCVCLSEIFELYTYTICACLATYYRNLYIKVTIVVVGIINYLFHKLVTFKTWQKNPKLMAVVCINLHSFSLLQEAVVIPAQYN